VIFFRPLTAFFSTGVSNDSTRTGDEQDDDIFDQRLGQLSAGHAFLETRDDLMAV
jgi:hypothetical protein